MEISELSSVEVLVLVTAAKHLVHADHTVSKSELSDLMSLGEAIGMQRFAKAMMECKDAYGGRFAVLELAEAVTRYDSKVLIFLLLEEIAKGDGLDDAEEGFLIDLRRRWEL